MSPTAIIDNHRVDLADLKSKVVDGHVELEETPKPPVADNFMYDFKYNHALPTTDALGVSIPDDVDAQNAAEEIVAKLSKVLSEGDAKGFTGLFLEYGVWRDKLAFTWDYRTFNFTENIARAAADLLPSTHCTNFKLLKPAPAIQKPYPDLSFLQFVLSFDTPLVQASAVINAVYTKEGWRLWTVHSVAESLLKFPELDPADGHMTGPVSWEKQREKDDDEVVPDVLIVGGGQNGLALAARLKALGVSSLIVERNAQIGEIWRKRYEYLSLHFPHWADHFPYFPFPKHWPTYTPAQKLGIFMEWYASAMELPVWTKSTVVKAEQDADGKWTVEVNKNGETRVLNPKHVVMATSLCGVPMTPVIPGMDKWKGTARHSTSHDSSREWVGKKVLVVGTSSSGFDTAYDCARRNIDVTLLQRSPTYIMSLTHSVPRNIGNFEPKNGVAPNIEEQDRVFNSMPMGPGEELARRNRAVLEELDKEMLDGLHAKGLKTYKGQRGTGQATLGSTRNGGFYFEAGACEQIIKGKIKVEQGYVESFTEDKVILSGGREREFDLVVFATGFSNTIDSVRQTLGDKIADQCGPIWGVDEEGEMKSAWKECGVPNLWLMIGYLPLTRYHSKLVALRIKALLEGVSPAPYKA
ncbi:flavin-containing monooxygenase [Cryptococcus neoformans Tu259-1]|uniref:Flavin-containing monooxygenase n=1 Tax=Cryptococcus neoformans Tu259-1 TaxID=1230072 RepID=A0A854QB85_CRYNE|nr:flavin-containing monooxygenase [Cryptococcus neoformans var. grubii AD1-83a]OXG20688.1 flavin-containing monooxygenase [Cryptococcus neoformans var. grubii Tu259-1]OXG59422.1 flavin-containing monooxygenase [Cryptococcus neoformans var. grubii MW-RSA1955]OXG63415.1 flavin-containing monooxygenase [Cryptococcus neoformans var. grubii c8]OXG64025.1 flavin-containing monooxygenase [Cryptococcus neoformans var. grubii CHC193]OXH10607.1 flavin-containing monooxygenase [Cryptococcus neoformans v